MITKNQIKFIQSLKLKKNRIKHNCFVVEGEKIINEVIKSDFEIIKLYGTESYSIDVSNTLFQRITDKDLKRISSFSSPNKFLAIVRAKHLNLTLNISTLLKEITLVLDNIKDPGNFGTIIRICHWFDVKNIICSSETVDMFNPKVIQASMGSILNVNIFYEDIEKLLRKLPKDFPIYGASLEGSSVCDTKIRSRGLLIMGSESCGISEHLHPFIKNKITIPRSILGSGPDSLNVAIATAILLHEFNK